MSGFKLGLALGEEALGQSHLRQQRGVLTEEVSCGVGAAWHGLEYTVPAARFKSTLN